MIPDASGPGDQLLLFGAGQVDEPGAEAGHAHYHARDYDPRAARSQPPGLTWAAGLGYDLG